MSTKSTEGGVVPLIPLVVAVEWMERVDLDVEMASDDCGTGLARRELSSRSMEGVGPPAPAQKST